MTDSERPPPSFLAEAMRSRKDPPPEPEGDAGPSWFSDALAGRRRKRPIVDNNNPPPPAA